MNKKRIMMVVLGALVIMLGTCAMTLKVDNDKKDELIQIEKTTYPDIYNTIDSITYDSFKEKVDNNEDFYVYVGRPTCGDCNAFEPDFINLIEEKKANSYIYYLNVAELRTDEEAWELFKETYNIQYTPTLAKFTDGNLSSKVEWTPEDGISTLAVSNWMEDNI